MFLSVKKKGEVVRKPFENRVVLGCFETIAL